MKVRTLLLLLAGSHRGSAAAAGLAYNPHTLNADNRHVKNSTVDRIFDLLHQTVVK